MDANESYLDRHMIEIDAAENAQDWKKNHIEELLHENGEYYPFKAENIIVALCNLDSGSELFLTTLITVAAEFEDNPVSQQSCTNALLYVIKNYWEMAARKKADIDYDNYYQELVK